MRPVLKVENLILTFHGAEEPAVKGVSLELMPEETLALVGESGSGKTALCRAIMMLHNQHAKIEGGYIEVNGKRVTDLSEKELEGVRGKDVAMVFQDPMSFLNPTVSIGDQIMQPMLLHEKISKKEAHERALRLMKMVEIDNAEVRMKQYPHHFSGGMRQRVAIAIALACNPHLLITDEPTTALDTKTQDKVMKLLQKVFKCSGKATLFITHDLGLAEDIADRVAVMKDGQIVEMGTTAEIFNNPTHPYTKKLLHYAKYGKGGSHYHGNIQSSCEEEENSKPEDVMVQVEKLNKCFKLGPKNYRKVITDFDMTVKRGEIVGLIGSSGCGKSTLARCIAGIHKPNSGIIRLADDARVQMIFQDSSSAFNPRMTIKEIIAEPLVINGGRRGKKKYSNKKDLWETVYNYMDMVGLDREVAERFPYNVSGGQRQRAAIARALITEPNFVIADEPISSLDVSIQAQIIHLMKKLHDEKNLTMLIIAHDLPMVEHISDRIIKLDSDK